MEVVDNGKTFSSRELFSAAIIENVINKHLKTLYVDYLYAGPCCFKACERNTRQIGNRASLSHCLCAAPIYHILIIMICCYRRGISAAVDYSMDLYFLRTLIQRRALNYFNAVVFLFLSPEEAMASAQLYFNLPVRNNWPHHFKFIT